MNVYLYPSDTETEVSNIYIGEYWWKPWANTLAYRPLESNANDIVWGYNWTSISWISYDTLSSWKKVAKITSSTSNISISWSIAWIIWSWDYTISYWIYMTWTVLSEIWLMFWVWTDSSPWEWPQIYLDTEWRWSAWALRFSTQYWNWVSSSSKNLLNKWHYITFTRESWACKWYIDWVLEWSFTSSTAFSSWNTWFLFARWTSHQCLASNSMGSEFILENKARTAQEISDYYNLTKSNYWL
jgi:hypothetical protein